MTDDFICLFSCPFYKKTVLHKNSDKMSLWEQSLDRGRESTPHPFFIRTAKDGNKLSFSAVHSPLFRPTTQNQFVLNNMALSKFKRSVMWHNTLKTQKQRPGIKRLGWGNNRMRRSLMKPRTDLPQILIRQLGWIRKCSLLGLKILSWVGYTVLGKTAGKAGFPR